MENYFGAEIRLFLLSMMGGIVSGIVFDIFKVKRSLKKCTRVTVFLQDIMFWILNFIISTFIIVKSESAIRGYAVFSCVSGFIIYRLTLSKYVVRISIIIVKFITRILKCVLKFLLLPIILVMKLLNKPILIIKLKFLKKLSKIRLTLYNFCFKIKRKMDIAVKFIKKG